MKAPTWHGKNDIRCDSVPAPLEDGPELYKTFRAKKTDASRS
jgi:hypothetical protein